MNTLLTIYRKYWTRLFSFKGRARGLSNPLLMDLSPEYHLQRVKLFVVGQQTCSGYNRSRISRAPSSVAHLMRIYRDEFRQGGCGRSTPFWQAARQLELSWGIERYAIAWSNLNRFDLNEGRPTPQIESEMAEAFDSLLSMEIEVAAPNRVVFFTGPEFDDRISRIWPGCEFAPTGRTESSCLARVEHPSLPSLSFRTYHPNYLRRSGRWETVLNAIATLGSPGRQSSRAA